MPKAVRSAEMVILTLLRKGVALDAPHVSNETGYSLNFVRRTLDRLTSEGKLKKDGGYRALYSWIEKVVVPGFEVATPRLVNVMAGTYDGRDLRPFSARPNAGQLVRRNP